MNPEFWLARWENGEIGFHLDHVNPHLPEHSSSFAGMTGQVLVPLCGKTIDMQWLCQQGCSVLGVELSELAVKAFFEQASLTPEVTQHGPFQRWQAGCLEILCGDFFQLTAADVAACTVIYDRAALIALPPELRTRYVHHLRAIFPQGVQMLLITLDYPQHEINGPPFSISAQEVQDWYAAYSDIRQLASLDVLQQNERFLQRGVSSLTEQVFHIGIRPCAS